MDAVPPERGVFLETSTRHNLNVKNVELGNALGTWVETSPGFEGGSKFFFDHARRMSAT